MTCADVDGAVMRYLEQNDLLSYWRQHTGHAIGLRNHEAPFLDLGDHTPIEPGMVFTIEPGVYADDIGVGAPVRHVGGVEGGLEELVFQQQPLAVPEPVVGGPPAPRPAGPGERAGCPAPGS